MLFKDLTETVLIDKIKRLKDDIFCFWQPGTVFYSVYSEVKELQLRKEYTPENGVGLYTQVLEELKGNSEAIHKVNQKMIDNGFLGHDHDHWHNESSLKLHLNLNNIAALDESVIFELVKFLVDAADSPENDLGFHFKIIRPDQHDKERFKDTDQITIYFDKYSSTGDMVKLADKIDAFLKSKGLPENSMKLGPKDSFGFNSFVSARFDTNKLLSQYDVYPFFDLELEKFFKAHNPEELKQIPLCALEAVFNNIMLSDITKLKSELTSEDSKTVQMEFEQMLVKPKEYIHRSAERWKVAYEKQKQQDYLLSLAIPQDLNKNPKINKLRKALDELEKYGENLKSNQADPLAQKKSEVALSLAKNLKNQLEIFIQKGDYSKSTYNAFNKKFTETLANKDTQELLKIHRDYKKVILANILIALTLIGSLFVVGKLAHSHVTTGKTVGFFAATKGEKHLKEIEKNTYKP